MAVILEELIHKRFINSESLVKHLALFSARSHRMKARKGGAEIPSTHR